MKNIGLYIHVPFCKQKCPYCDFYSVAASENELDRYTEFTSQKIKSLVGKFTADTVYFGGGTPSLLGTTRLAQLLDSAAPILGNETEITAEINPESAVNIDFSELKKHGLNRVSIGLQSSNDAELSLLGRRHSADDAANAVRRIQASGITNISLDLMLGISGQTASSLRESIDFCSDLGVTHISAYMLKIEKGTAYYKKKNALHLPDEDVVCQLYEHAVSELAAHGYDQYEISNFAKKGYESRHNLKYWRCEEYLGIGPAAHSFLDGERYFYARSFSDYYSDITQNDGEGGSQEEYSALALRLSEGLIFEKYMERFSKPFPEKYITNARKLIPAGLVTVSDKRIALTPKGFLLSNAVTADILF